MWPDQRVLDLFKIEHPVVLAPMAGAMDTGLAIAVADAGGLASLPIAMLDERQMRDQMEKFRAATDKPVNLNFFCHKPSVPNNAREHAWREKLKPYYVEYGIDPAVSVPSTNRIPFDEAQCSVVEELKPEVVSFHFGLPAPALLARVKDAGCIVMASATTVAEARWLEANGCDAIIAQGFEAGGHRGMFLTDNLATQVGTFALVPQVVDAVKVPVIAAGGITDARGIVAAFALGASAVQMGTAYSVLSGIEDSASASRRARQRERRWDRCDQPANGETGARPHKPRHARAGTRQRCRAGISAGRRRAGAPECQGAVARLRRFLEHVGRAGGWPRPRHARARIDANPGD